jgi:hypothetical protein
MSRGESARGTLRDYLVVLALALLPAVGNFLGGVLAEISEVSQRTLSLALHVAAGVVLAVVGIELIPEALEVDRPWIPLLALVLGGLGFILLERAIGWVRGRFSGVEAGANPDARAQKGGARKPTRARGRSMLAWRSTSSATA